MARWPKSLMTCIFYWRSTSKNLVASSRSSVTNRHSIWPISISSHWASALFSKTRFGFIGRIGLSLLLFGDHRSFTHASPASLHLQSELVGSQLLGIPSMLGPPLFSHLKFDDYLTCLAHRSTMQQPQIAFWFVALAWAPQSSFCFFPKSHTFVWSQNTTS